MVFARGALRELQKISRGKHRRAVEFGEQFFRKFLVDERHRPEERPVEQRRSHVGADAEILVGLEHRVDMLLIDARRDVGVVAQRGGAAVHRLQRADHRAQIHVAGGERDRLERPDIVHPELERQVILAALVVALVTVVMAVDQAGGQQPAGHFDHCAFGRLGAARANILDHAAVDDDIDRALARRCVFTQQSNRARQRFSHCHLRRCMIVGGSAHRIFESAPSNNLEKGPSLPGEPSCTQVSSQSLRRREPMNKMRSLMERFDRQDLF